MELLNWLESGSPLYPLGIGPFQPPNTHYAAEAFRRALPQGDFWRLFASPGETVRSFPANLAMSFCYFLTLPVFALFLLAPAQIALAAQSRILTDAMENRFRRIEASVERIRARILRESRAPGIYFEDYPDLASFSCPEWSHLIAEDSVEFTRRIAPRLRAALER